MQLRCISVDSPRVADVVDIAQSHCFFAVHSKLFSSLMRTVEQCAENPDYYMSKLPFLRLVSPNTHVKLTQAFKIWRETTPRDRSLKDDSKRFEAYEGVAKYSYLTSNQSHLGSEHKEQVKEQMRDSRDICRDLANHLKPHHIEMLVPTPCPSTSNIAAKRAAVAARFFDALQGHASRMLPMSKIAFETLFFYENRIALLPCDHPSYTKEQQADARTVYGMHKCSQQEYASACKRMRDVHMRSDSVNPISRDSVFEETLHGKVQHYSHSPIDTITDLLALEDGISSLFDECKDDDDPNEWTVYTLYLKFFAPIAYGLFRGGILVEIDVGDM